MSEPRVDRDFHNGNPTPGPSPDLREFPPRRIKPQRLSTASVRPLRDRLSVGGSIPAASTM
jgi:hypothetical protein